MTRFNWSGRGCGRRHRPLSLRAVAAVAALVIASASVQTARATPDREWALDGRGPSEPLEVRVRIAHIDKPLSVVGVGLMLVGDHETIRVASDDGRASFSSARLATLKLKPQAIAGRVLWNVVDAPSGRALGRVLGERLELRGEMLRVNLKPIPKAAILSTGIKNGRLRGVDVIAPMDLETYLSGVLPREMPADWPMEALKAQAVASRSFTLYRLRQRKGREYHLESGVTDQVFAWREVTGNAKKDAEEEARFARVREALRQTAAEALSDRAGRVLAGYFHADCGGRTEEASAVWGAGIMAAGTAVDQGCPFSPAARWSLTVGPAELYARLRGILGLQGEGLVKEIKAQRKTGSGRVAHLALVTDKGGAHKLSGQQLREILGFDQLRSTAFEVSRDERGAFRFAGRGYGHGVGLCQWGARRLALEGADYRRILSHYYPRSKLVRIRP